MKLRLLLSLPLLCATSLTALADDQWDVTTSFEMTGMPFQMPPQTHQVCVAAGQHADEKGLQSNKDCDVSNIKRSGSSLRFHMECHGHMKMSGDGKITHSADSYNGDIKMTGNFGDSGNSTVHVQYEGHKTGTCDASSAGAGAGAPGAMMGGAGNPYAGMMQRQQAMVGAAMDQQCVAQLDKWDLPQPFIGANAYCQAQAGDYCKAVSKALKGADATALGAVAREHPHWQQAGKACGMDTDAMAQQSCDAAKAQKNWSGVAAACPDAEDMAKANCTGPSYTAVTSGPYGGLCQAFATDIKVTPSAAGTAANVGSTVMDGVNKFRSLFGH
jgi:hypothetical protein